MSSSSKASAVAALLVMPAAFWVAYSFQGCTVLSNDAPLDEAGVFDGGQAGPNNTTDCNACVAESCSGEWSACFASADCVALLECASATGCDANCRAQCACSNPAGVNLYAAAQRCDQPQRCTSGMCNAACVAASNVASCGLAIPQCATTQTDAGTATEAGTAPPVTAATCGSCIGGSCGDQKQQCPATSDCDLYLSCGVACTTASCIDDCGSSHATGKQASSQLAQCVTTSCTPQCGL